jgi:nitrite reductase/ring-hydroxylating ferredoxin subunit
MLPQHCPAAGSDASRREFLQGAGCLAGALALFGIADAALAAPVSAISGASAGADRVYPLPAADGISVDKASQVILVRASGHVYAFALSCPHQNAAVKWVEKNGRFECTKHDSKYQADGVHTSGRATRNMDRYPIRREGDSIHVDTARVFQSDKDSAGWNGASVAV